MNDKIEEAEVLFTTFADGNFEKRSMHSKRCFELPQFLSKGPAKSKSTSSLVQKGSVTSPYCSYTKSLSNSYQT